MKRDRISNEKIINFLVPASYTAGTHVSSTIDMQTAQTSVGGSREAISNLLLALTVGATWGALGTIDITIQHSLDGTTFTTHSTVAQITQASGETLFLAELKDFRRYVRLSVVVAVGTCLCAIVGNGSRSRRERVVQLGTEVAVTEA